MYRNYLQHYRRQAKVSQLDLAKRLGGGVTRVIVSNWETGLSDPTEGQKKLIANILKVWSEILFPKYVNADSPSIRQKCGARRK